MVSVFSKIASLGEHIQQTSHLIVCYIPFMYIPMVHKYETSRYFPHFSAFLPPYLILSELQILSSLGLYYPITIPSVR